MPETTTSTVSYDPEIRNRIRLAVAAYAYEVEDDPVMSDAEFDRLAKSTDPRVLTGHALCDLFFLESFEPHTGSWIHDYPDLPGIERIYRDHYKDRLI